MTASPGCQDSIELHVEFGAAAKSALNDFTQRGQNVPGAVSNTMLS
eukprot:CAMPEP_0195105000 /NCGR_PEP_ID=MMETSP0448-20130528/74566_1 /TAXON_ID=66468 /ORGANISM="Heterocapsa triquestra, Strain CCMP 448" /LENGTH=45 /DNA_ID= /DNA_START= /DNA_END= /DNA_ORIENTATION=